MQMRVLVREFHVDLLGERQEEAAEDCSPHQQPSWKVLHGRTGCALVQCELEKKAVCDVDRAASFNLTRSGTDAAATPYMGRRWNGFGGSLSPNIRQTDQVFLILQP